MIPLLLSLAVATLESITYLGFVAKHFFVPTPLIYLATFFYLLVSPGRDPRWSKYLSSPLWYFALLTSATYIVFAVIEAFTYENYIFSHTHVSLAGLAVLVAVVVVGYGLHVGKLKQGVVAGFTLIFIYNLAGILPLVFKSLQPIIAHPFATYDQKMTAHYPGFYPAMQMIADLTPEHATIIIPPQSAPWVMEGNEALVSRFLYPRRVVHTTDFSGLSGPDIYALIALGSWPEDGTWAKGWPKVALPAKHIWQFDLVTGVASKIERDYDPLTDRFDWGLIEVRYD